MGSNPAPLNMSKTIKTCEFVSPKHPDKLCDFIADSILDAYLAQDRDSRVAIEVMGGHDALTISGEVTTRAKFDVRDFARNFIGKGPRLNIHVVRQSPFIARGVDSGGAGDQGIMMGYATNETPNFMPKEYELSRILCREVYKHYPYDGKVQVTLKGDSLLSVVVSFQNSKTKELEKLVRSLVKAEEYFINPAGEWELGGFDADSGLSGRKIVVDNYGPEVHVGGGSFSGKDYTKVDRSAAYMARRIAVDYLKKHRAHEVRTKLAYVIGKAQPVMKVVMFDGKEEEIQGYDLTPGGMRKFLKLDEALYAPTAQWGHFGNGFIWDS